ncbi:hypothetical protein Bhyg_15897, partial [Pseudolycoriella hygida]
MVEVLKDELKDCYEQMCQNNKFNESDPTRRNASNYRIKLHCRDDTSLVVRIIGENETESGNPEYSQPKKANGDLYMVRKVRSANQSIGKSFSWFELLPPTSMNKGYAQVESQISPLFPVLDILKNYLISLAAQ